jgi:hypothetical protein
MRRLSFGIVLTLAVSLSGLVGTAAAAPAGGTELTVTGPVTGGQGYPSLLTTNFDLADVGYERAEYFLEGTATSYQAAAPFKADGKWKVTEKDTAPYKTRMVVYRPIDPKDFSGTVFLEWLNVSAGFDTSPDWLVAHNQMIRSGAAWVGVSAQAIGIQGGADVIPGAATGGIKAGDPERYGSLEHPGDAYSYDIYTQAGKAVAGDAKGVDPMGDLDVKRVIAVGESQSAFRLTTYVNAIQPRTKVFDGFLIHSRGAGAAPLGESQFSQKDASTPDDAHIRTDIGAPVLTFQTESDFLRLGFLPARQPDSKSFRLWEVAGTSHADTYTTSLGLGDLGDGKAELALLDPATASGGVLRCAQPINSGPAAAVLTAGLKHLEEWVKGGAPPAHAPRLVFADTTGKTLERDQYGNAEGGIRTPLVDVPLAANTGETNAGGTFCSLFGTTTPLDTATLASLYSSHADYVKKFDASADKTVKAGFWLTPEAENFKAAAQKIAVP